MPLAVTDIQKHGERFLLVAIGSRGSGHPLQLGSTSRVFLECEICICFQQGCLLILSLDQQDLVGDGKAVSGVGSRRLQHRGNDLLQYFTQPIAFPPIKVWCRIARRVQLGQLVELIDRRCLFGFAAHQ